MENPTKTEFGEFSKRRNYTSPSISRRQSQEKISVLRSDPPIPSVDSYENDATPATAWATINPILAPGSLPDFLSVGSYQVAY